MRKSTLIWLITAISLVLIGCVIWGGVMTMFGWDSTKLSTIKYETTNYEILENYKNISVVTNTANVVFVLSENEKSSVTCHKQKNVKHSVSVKDNTLTIEVVDTRKWYEYIGISFGASKITISIPQNQYGALSVKGKTGDVEIPEGFLFEHIDISESTGHVTSCASASETIKIKTSTGSISIENTSAVHIDLSVSTGKTHIVDTKCKTIVSKGSTGNITLKNVIASEKLSVTRSTGDVKLEHCDAAEIFIETDTGNVAGSLLSDKVFITQTHTGRIDVPKTTTGGKCQIATDTGHIKITIEKSLH